jgi:hypothetical protein
MNKLFAIIFLAFLYSCSNSISTKQTYVLPSDSLINDVIYSVIKLDSLNFNHGIVRLLSKIKVYPVPPPDSTPMPTPPPPPGGYYYRDLLEFLSPNNQIERKKDSIFLSYQSERSENILIVDSLFQKFANESRHIYEFDVPVFSFDKKKVYVEYWDNCGPLCGLCYCDVLNWTKSGWIRIDQYHCGIR